MRTIGKGCSMNMVAKCRAIAERACKDKYRMALHILKGSLHG